MGGQEVYVDRDWWLFRYVLTFLRDGLVPQSRSLALQLYREAAFWRLTTLQTAIEEAHLNLVTEDRAQGRRARGDAAGQEDQVLAQQAQLVGVAGREEVDRRAQGEGARVVARPRRGQDEEVPELVLH